MLLSALQKVRRSPPFYEDIRLTPCLSSLSSQPMLLQGWSPSFWTRGRQDPSRSPTLACHRRKKQLTREYMNLVLTDTHTYIVSSICSLPARLRSLSPQMSRFVRRRTMLTTARKRTVNFFSSLSSDSASRSSAERFIITIHVHSNQPPSKG